MLENGHYPVPPGKLAVIISFLEMRAPVVRDAPPLPAGISIETVDTPDLDWYRDLFRRVGGDDWLWFSRLTLDDQALATIIHDPKIEVRAVMRDGQAEGLLELDFRTEGACELAFFGLTQTMIGTGVGRALMATAIARAFESPIERLHLQTCTGDSPQALPFYLRSGFQPVRQQVEIYDDPRLNGLLPKSAGHRVPLYPG